ncbi:MAG TPA: ABC transporter permease [Candidatus Limnocylindrales bacterium]|nr:ABC transporter permease [Candidatus Limnocylindrales bacterium]
MIRVLIRRLGLLAITLLIASALVFALTVLLPGDTARLILGRDARPEALEALREELGLNQPVYTQYANWLTGYLSGDWGRSFTGGSAPVRPLVLERLGNSLQLAFLAILLSVPLSIALGTIAGLRENKTTDVVISVGSLAIVGLPEFVTSLILIAVFARGLGWLPASSRAPDPSDPGEWLRNLLLPALAASFVLIAYIVRMTRAGVIEELRKPYVRTAVLKGLPRRTVIVKHVLRNALLPTITIIALSFGWLIGGLVVIENVFNYPGLGRLMTAAVERKDTPLLQASVMTVIFVFAFANLLADLLYSLLNPRIRFE